MAWSEVGYTGDAITRGASKVTIALFDTVADMLRGGGLVVVLSSLLSYVQPRWPQPRSFCT